MEAEPKINKCGIHLVTIKGFKFVLCYTRTKRGKRNYAVVWPGIAVTGDWEACMTECELHVVLHTPKRSHRKAPVRRRS